MAHRRHRHPGVRRPATRCGAASTASRRRSVRTPYELIVVDDGDARTPELDALPAASCADARRAPCVDAAGAPGLRRGGESRASDCIAIATWSILHADAEVADDWLDRLVAHATARGRRRRRHVHQQRRHRDLSVAAQPRIRCPTGADGGVARRAVRARQRGVRRRAADRRRALPVLPARLPRAPSARFDGAIRSAATTASRSTSACAPAAPGFRHLLAGDVFVGHEGHASFGTREAAGARERAQKALAKLYPSYRGAARRTSPSASPTRAVRAPRRPSAPRGVGQAARSCSCRIRGAAASAAT